MGKFDWKKCKEVRPPNESGKFMFRITAEILGMTLTPQWVEEMHYCGMGYGDNEWWPLSVQKWDGYRRYFTGDYEWRELTKERSVSPKRYIKWGGSDLDDCPFTGEQPNVAFHGRWIGAPPDKAEWLSLTSGPVALSGRRKAKALQREWNTRAPDPRVAALEVEIERQRVIILALQKGPANNPPETGKEKDQI